MLLRPFLARAALAASSLTALACGKEIKQTYSIAIVGQPGADPFGAATTAILEVNGAEVARSPAHSRAPISLTMPSLDPNMFPTAKFAVRAIDATGKVVAYGRTPELEVLNISAAVSIFVQAPGTLARGEDTENPVSQHTAVAAVSFAFSQPFSLPMIVPVFATGRTRLSSQGTADVFWAELLIYNPITHFAEDLGTLARINGVLEARTGASALARPDGDVFIFGGFAAPIGGDASADASMGTASGQLDTLQILRDGFSGFGAGVVAPATRDDKVRRSGAALAQVGNPVYAIGGLDDQRQPLDSIVLLDVVDSIAKSVIIKTTLLAKRSGHTATTVEAGPIDLEVLVFGGAADDAPVAEIFDPKKDKGMALTLDAKARRRNHVALLLPPGGDRVLIIGGVDGTTVRDDILVYYPLEHRFAEAPFKLQTARQGFAAFVVANDIVIAGGRGTNGELLGNAEIFELDTLAPVGVVPASPRAGATATVLDNESAVLIGGEVANISDPTLTIPTSIVEIYQPRR